MANASKAVFTSPSLCGRLVLVTALFRGFISGLVSSLVSSLVSGLVSAGAACHDLEDGLVRLPVRLAHRVVVGRRDGLQGRRRVGCVLGVVFEDVADATAGTRLQLCSAVY